MKFLLNIGSAAAILLLAGCAGMGAHKVLELDTNQSILVVSSMGNNFELIHIGTTVFSNDRKTIPVDEWDIDSMIESEITSLSEVSRFDISNHSDLPFNITSEFMTSLWTLEVNFHDHRDEIFSFAKKEGYDLLLVVNSFENEDSIFQTNQYYSGYGLLKRTFFDYEQAAFYARTSATLYDVATSKKITGSWDTTAQAAKKHKNDQDLSMITIETISEDRARIQSMIMESIFDQLKQLNIIQKKPI